MNQKETHDKIVDSGKGDSFLKGGKPKTPIEKTIGYGYGITLAIFALLNVVLMWIFRNKFRWKPLIATVLIGTFAGEAFGIFMAIYDTAFPGWLFHPWTSIELSTWLQVPEDWVFYPICGILFVMIMIAVPITNRENKMHNLRLSIFIVNFLICLVTAFIYKWAVWIQLILFGVPGLALYLYAFERIQPVHYIKCAVAFCLLAWSWDFLSVYYFHSIPGLAWAQHWTYISFDNAGHYIHSSAYLDYATHRWSWNFQLPSEITPLFSIFGTMFIYPLYAAANKYLG